VDTTRAGRDQSFREHIGAEFIIPTYNCQGKLPVKCRTICNLSTTWGRTQMVEFRMMSKKKVWPVLISLGLLAAVLIQGYSYLLETGPALLRVRTVAGQSAVWRSAAFNLGEEFAGYIVFLNSNIPLAARVVLPPADVQPAGLGTTPYMQYFLAPRQVINCGDAACLLQLRAENTYILVTENFPGSHIPAGFGSVSMFNQKWGYLPPAGDPRPLPEAPREFDSYLALLSAALAPGLWLGMITLSGAAWVARLLPAAGRGLRLGLGYGLGLAAFSAGMALLSLTGLPLNRTTLWGMSALIGISAALLLPRNWRFLLSSPTNLLKRQQPANWMVLAFILGLGGAAAILAVGRGYSVSDELLLWGTKGYGIAATGSIRQVMDWGTNTVEYPLHLPLLIAAFKILFGEILPASKLLPAGYYTALLLVAYSAMARTGLRHWWAVLMVLLLGTMPLVSRHATMNYANLPMSFYMICAALLLVRAVSHEHPTDIHLYLAGGVFLAAAAWTRPEGLVFGWLLLLYLLARSLCRRSGRPVLQSLAPVLVYTLFWLVLKEAVYTRPAGQSGLAGAALSQFMAGEWHLGNAIYLGRALVTHLFSTISWGLLGAGMVLSGLITLFKGSALPRQARLLLESGALYVLGVFGMYYLASYDANHDMNWWINTGLDRMLLPAVLLSGLGSAAWLKLLDHRKDRARPAHLV
jgi:hypothetical protein